MLTVFVTDIFGSSEALQQLAKQIAEQDYVIIDPYAGKKMNFSNEQAAYHYFNEQVGLATYAQHVLTALNRITQAFNIIAFSVGGSAVWLNAEKLASTKVNKINCFYASQIRAYLSIRPSKTLTLILPKSENHFNINTFKKELTNIHQVKVIHSNYLHGFMNQLSENYNNQGFQEYIGKLRSHSLIKKESFDNAHRRECLYSDSAIPIMNITTQRLILRPVTQSDFERTYQLLSDPEVMRFSLNGPYNEQKTADFINHCIQQSANNLPSLLAVVDKATDQLIGYCGFYNQKINGIEEIELGYRLLKEYWGKGLASEAAMAMKNHAFENMGLNRLISIIEHANIGSIRVAEKTGLKLEKRMLYNGKIHVGIYALNASPLSQLA